MPLVNMTGGSLSAPPQPSLEPGPLFKACLEKLYGDDPKKQKELLAIFKSQDPCTLTQQAMNNWIKVLLDYNGALPNPDDQSVSEQTRALWQAKQYALLYGWGELPGGETIASFAHRNGLVKHRSEPDETLNQVHEEMGALKMTKELKLVLPPPPKPAPYHPVKAEPISDQIILSNIYHLYGEVLQETFRRCYPKDPFAETPPKSEAREMRLTRQDIIDAITLHIENEGVEPVKHSGYARYGFLKGKITWGAINARMLRGDVEGIPAGTSLSAFRRQMDFKGKSNRELVFLSKNLVELSIWLHLLNKKTGPHKTLGLLEYGPLKNKISWGGIDKAMKEGRITGIPAGTTLSTYKESLGIKVLIKNTRVTKEILEDAIMLHIQNTGEVPSKTSGMLLYGELAGRISWGRINAQLAEQKIEGVGTMTLSQSVNRLVRDQAAKHRDVYGCLPGGESEQPLVDYPDVKWPVVRDALVNKKGHKREDLDDILISLLHLPQDSFTPSDLTPSP